MNIFNIIIIFIIIMSGITGWKRGVLKETIFLIGTILIFIIAFNLKGTIGNFLCKYLPFFEFSGNLEGLVSLNILIYQAIAFILIVSILYALFNIVMTVTKIMQKILNATIILLIPSKILGMIIGLIQGYIIAFAIIVILAIPLKQVPEYQNSSLANKIMYNSPILSNTIGDFTNTISDIYKIVDNINDNNKNTNEINLEIIDVMLKYKIVSVKTVKQLDVLNKLKDINNLNNIIKKYE